jgi:uncharacterized protein Usg
MTHNPELTLALAKKWGVTRRTAQNWVSQGRPVHDEEALAGDLVRRGRISTKLLARAQRVLEDARRRREITSENDSADFSPPTEKGERGFMWLNVGEGYGEPDFDRLIQTYWDQWNAAMEVKAGNLIEFWDKRYQAAVKAKHAAELHEKKLGLEKGEILGREQFRHLVDVMIFHLLRGIEAEGKDLAPRLLELSFVEEVHHRLTEHRVMSRILVPFIKMAEAAGPLGVPGFVVEQIKDRVDQYVQDGGRRLAQAIEEGPAGDE